MPYTTLPINISGPTYRDRSRPLSSQETRNIYHELVESGKEQYVLKSFPGQKSFGSATAGEDRGQHQMREVGYRVIGTDLYEISNTGTHTNRGDVPGTDRCIIASDGINMFLVANGIVSQYSSATNLVTAVTDVNIVGAISVDFINNQFVYTFPQLTVFSVVGDGSTALGTNAVNSEINGDDLVRDYVFDQTLYRFGTRSCPNWWNSGVGTPPFTRIEGQQVATGLAAKHSITSSRSYIYWLGTDLQVYRARSGQEEPISSAVVSGEIQGYAKIDDAFGEVFTIDSKTMYLLTFPTENKTWCLSEELGVNGWFELSEGITSNRYNAGSIVEVYNKVLIGDRSNGSLYELDFSTYDQGGSTWRRRRVIGSVNGDAFKQKGKRVKIKRMEFLLETGVGLSTGQGSDPKIMLEYSTDGGRSWKTGSWLRIGRQGETNVRAEWFTIKSFYDMMVRLTTSDPVALNLYSAAVDIKLSGR